MFSKSCEYAIKAMIYVAQNTKDGSRIGVKEIAKNTDAPEHFVAKIMQDLSRKKIIHSVKGPNGGFYLTSNDMSCTLAEIVKAIDGDKIFTNCVLGLKTCSEKNPCPVHFQYKEIKRNIMELVENNTISDFKERLDSGKYFLKND